MSVIAHPDSRRRGPAQEYLYWRKMYHLLTTGEPVFAALLPAVGRPKLWRQYRAYREIEQRGSDVDRQMSRGYGARGVNHFFDVRLQRRRQIRRGTERTLLVTANVCVGAAATVFVGAPLEMAAWFGAIAAAAGAAVNPAAAAKSFKIVYRLAQRARTFVTTKSHEKTANAEIVKTRHLTVVKDAPVDPIDELATSVGHAQENRVRDKLKTLKPGHYTFLLLNRQDLAEAQNAVISRTDIGIELETKRLDVSRTMGSFEQKLWRISHWRAARNASVFGGFSLAVGIGVATASPIAGLWALGVSWGFGAAAAGVAKVLHRDTAEAEGSLYEDFRAEKRLRRYFDAYSIDLLKLVTAKDMPYLALEVKTQGQPEGLSDSGAIDAALRMVEERLDQATHRLVGTPERAARILKHAGVKFEGAQVERVAAAAMTARMNREANEFALADLLVHVPSKVADITSGRVNVGIRSKVAHAFDHASVSER